MAYGRFPPVAVIQKYPMSGGWFMLTLCHINSMGFRHVLAG
jgi:hypothetical protein